MTAENNTVSLYVSGKAYAGWKSVRIAAGIERAARDFEVSITDKWPGSPEQSRHIRPGDFVRVLIGQDVLITGYVDATPFEYDARGYTFLIRGRSKTADLIDSAPDNDAQQWKNQKPEQIASEMAGPYGVDVKADAATGDVLSEHQVQQGETVFESMDRIAKQRQLLITDNANGQLILAKPGSGGKASTALELGKNILSGSAGFDFSEVYSDYNVKGQRSGDDEQFGEDVAQGIGRATDSSVQRRRVLVVRQAGQADAKTLQERASYEQQVRRARAGEIRYVVAGWRQSNGTLWMPNQTVSIKDSWMEVDGELLIAETIFTLSAQGMTTELVCIAPEAFLTEPVAVEAQADDPNIEWMPPPSTTGNAESSQTPSSHISWEKIDKP